MLAGLTVCSIVAGCASPSPGALGHRSPEEQTPALALTDLQGIWERDDGQRYVLVADQERLIGGRVEAGQRAEFSALLVLTSNGARLRGQAWFTRVADRRLLWRSRWELSPGPGPGRLEGRVEVVELDLEQDDREVERSWEPRRLERVEALAPEQARQARRLWCARLASAEAELAGEREPLAWAASLAERPLSPSPSRVGFTLPASYRRPVADAPAVAEVSEEGRLPGAPSPTHCFRLARWSVERSAGVHALFGRGAGAARSLEASLAYGREHPHGLHWTQAFLGRLGEVTSVGPDEARATACHERDGRGVTLSLRFQRIEGLWFVELLGAEPALRGEQRDEVNESSRSP